jgi:putative ABC transport system ATP-binding protein
LVNFELADNTVPDSKNILQLHSLLYQWPGHNSFSLSIPKFELLTGQTALLIGESGSGKSTLLSLICGTVKAHKGVVSVAGTNLSLLSSGQRDKFRGENIGYIFQQFNLLPYASVEDNILLPLQFAPNRRAKVTCPHDEAQRLCNVLGLPKNILSTKARTLSVGQQQRVAAARALIGSPPVLIADEPTSALDAATQKKFLELLFEQSKNNKSTLLFVSHDIRLADQFDKVIHMADIVARKSGKL